ncbi:hypothetical protein MWMV2_MWMV2_01767 [Acinetobacter oleivorans]|uniref:Uncharacterized protein n=1 Tax=Acinetobacter oleivorans (strain JCM 16667 / KCTC 23045 / DR1) TaxID=436717 RepID=A0AAN0P7F9_ACISD|nr:MULTISPECIES: hypothetical protein [Acinetobacter]ADI90248.1 hypothetical protein AOLE_06775 [Acinetobacter oleivorans DR1]ENX43470.1 hypothetical protein F886_02819 [Acinetobacter sp. NIPH 542]ESK46723.1 hypothetical protein P254_00612 [Acinetobacter oleivorans CIP 110421]CAI3129529.1 hypothetical protein MWMV19_MWMV19_01478 [Acinetobacter oleivorans]CAI3133713.1 hypothetical protein MWMV3_MWMV3_01767 [Acinetobacter oleivorans]
MSQANKLHSESKATTVVAWGVILFGIVLGIAFILSYGQVETRNDNLDIIQVWSKEMVTVGLFIIFNGLLFGYLLLKISSILNHLENNKN